MTTEYKAYEANPLGYRNEVERRAGVNGSVSVAAYDALLDFAAKTLSKYEPLPDPVEECLRAARDEWGAMRSGVKWEQFVANALRSAGLVKS